MSRYRVACTQRSALRTRDGGCLGAASSCSSTTKSYASPPPSLREPCCARKNQSLFFPF